MTKNEFLEGFKTNRWEQKTVKFKDVDKATLSLHTTLLHSDPNYLECLDRELNKVEWNEIAEITVTPVQDLMDQTKLNQIIAIRLEVNHTYDIQWPSNFPPINLTTKLETKND